MPDVDYPDSWADRLDFMETEMAIIEKTVSADQVGVKTYPDRTTVTLTYEHE
jgi:hypothetical protein